MKYKILLSLYILLVQGQVKRNVQLVLNEMGPGRTSRAWYFHSPGHQVSYVARVIPGLKTLGCRQILVLSESGSFISGVTQYGSNLYGCIFQLLFSLYLNKFKEKVQ